MSWRFHLREAETALNQGRLEDAVGILRAGDLLSYHPAKQLLTDLARRFASRAEERAAQGEADAAWADLDRSRELAGESSPWQEAQRTVGKRLTQQVAVHLAAEDFYSAERQLELLARRLGAASQLSALRETTRRLQSASKLRRRGKFVEAEEQFVAALALGGQAFSLEEPFLAQQLARCREDAATSRGLHEELHRALAESNWTIVLALAERLLALAPLCPVARDARKRAWQVVGAPLKDSRRTDETDHWTSSPAEPGAPPKTRGKRFLLWVDAVGGYLVCLGDQVVVGQSQPGNTVDVPIQADLPRRHIAIRREQEGYILEPLVEMENAPRAARIQLDGKQITSPALLGDGDEIELGDGVRLRFRKPHALSATARLEILSRHRTQPYADAVLLMAESAVLGPKWQNHVICRDWSGDLVLFRQDEKLFCRALQSVEIDGRLHDGRGPLAYTSRILGPDFSLTLEPLKGEG